MRASLSRGSGAKTRSASRLLVRLTVILGSVLARSTEAPLEVKPKDRGDVGGGKGSSEISVEKRSFLGDELELDLRRILRFSRPSVLLVGYSIFFFRVEDGP